MSKHKGNKEPEQGTQAGKPFSKMTPEEKAREFDASYNRPVSYAHKNFKDAKPGEGGNIHGGGKSKHKKQK